MDNSISLLITICMGDYLLRCALKVDIDEFPDDVMKHPLEPENKEQIKGVLPLHVKDSGEIVEVVRIFDVVDARRPTTGLPLQQQQE